ncbi:type IV secretory system conjugative DNA transfer family protein [Actinokineospora sp. HUAS TT18]|uniref:type IV secretory system conjugative DNA transfer family protein n=1 Tax=Actinokineospora sp. HUAS TT18 TaxID=3447451 RepID=UPI003F51F792
MSAEVRLKASGVGIAAGVAGWFVMRSPSFGEVTRYGAWAVVVGAALTVSAIVWRARNPRARLLVLAVLIATTGFWLGTDVVPAGTPGRELGMLLSIGGVLAAVLVAVSWWYSRRGSAQVVNRWSRKSRRNDGVASPWAILRTASWFAVRRRAGVVRPSLAELSWWRRWRTPIRQFATPVARVGIFRVWSLVEDVTLRFGGPRTGKTGELACRILDAPGALIATSTRTDLIDVTGAVRAQLGPVHVFNPSGVGGLASTITFNPLSGCEDPAVATSRAADLLSGVSSPGAGGGDREFWAGQARRVLAALMYAAALGKGSMRDVLAWVADPDNAAQAVSRNLRRQPDKAWESDALQFLSTNERTRSSICSTIMPALGWLTDATAAKAAEDGEFDVEALLDTRGTVYMLGAEDAQTAPLVTALTGHIARQARKLAGFAPGGRLDPPLTLALDEAALVCPIPLDNWTADMGGRGVTIHIALQSRAQLRAKWGDTGAGAIMNNAATLLIFGGTRDHDDLNAYSALTGERDETVDTVDADRNVTSTTTRRVPVLSPGQIAQLPAGHVVVIRRGMAPAVGKTEMAWKRRDVRKAKRSARWHERLDRFVAWRERVADAVAPWMAAAGDRADEMRAQFAEFRAARQATRETDRAAADAARTVQAEIVELSEMAERVDAERRWDR